MKAKIFPYFSKIYKNGNETALPLPDTSVPIGQYDFNIGDFGKIVDLTQYDAIYYSNDTNQEHPVYIMKPEYRANKINLNEETISTFFVNDDDYNDLGDGFAVKNDKVIGFGFDNNNVNYTDYNYASGYEGEVAPADRYNQVPYNETRYFYKETFSELIPRAKLVYQEVFENGTVEGIRAIYDSRDDSMMAPAMNMNTNHFEYYNQNGTDIYMRSSFGYSGSTTNSFQYGGSNRNGPLGYSGSFQVRQEVQDNPEEIKYVEFYPPVPYNATKVNDSAAWTMGYGTRTGTSLSNIKTVPVFLKDSNGEYWILFICRLDAYSTYSYGRPYVFTRWAPMVIKVKDIPVNMPSNGTIASGVAEWITDAHFTSPSVLDEYLDAVFGNPSAGGNYDDGGADITDAIGGDENKVDEIETDDGKWNNGLATVRGWGNYFGSYVVGRDQLAQYSGTLSMLFSSRDLFSNVFEYMGEKIQRNTMDLIMLPYPINSGIELRKFVVGNVAIANDPSDPGQWAVGNNQANANILIDPVKTDVVNLGTINRYYDSFLDFAPYSSASLYIPYIGTVELPINIIQSTSGDTKNLQLLFRIDSSTGDMVVLLQVNGSTIKQWTGNCAKNIQINIEGDGQFIKQMASKVTGTVLGISTGAIGHSIAGGANSINTTFNPVKRLGALGRGLNLTNPDTKAAASLGNPIAKGQLDVSMGLAQEMMMPNSNPISTHSVGSSSTTGDVGYLGPQQVILYVERPIEWKPEGYEGIVGRPTKKIAKLGSVKGFAQVSHLHLRCAATEAEKNEITQMLNAGVIF